ncbi:MAG: cytochrome c1 [Pseudomonadota bacterium]
MYIRRFLLSVTVALIGLSPLSALASSSGAEHIPDLKWSFDGPFGTYDRASLQRGLQVYRQVCSACHALEHRSYRNLADLGYSEAQIKTIAAEYTVTDGPNDDGEMFDRPARPSDVFKAPFANEKQARASNNGAYPPDLSLITKARIGGANYVYGVLTGYADAPEGVTLQPGQYYNKTMNGHILAMAPPLVEGAIAYEDGSPTTVDQYARDVAHFLTWAAEPEMEQRKRMGVKVFLFLAVFAGIMYATKRQIWSDQH